MAWMTITMLKQSYILLLIGISTSAAVTPDDLSLSDDHYDRHQSYRYASVHPSGVGSHSAASNHWFYKSAKTKKRMSVGTDGLPPALTPIDRLLSTGWLSDSHSRAIGGISGRFPFASRQKYSRKPSPVVAIPDIPNIPDIPPLPELNGHYRSEPYFHRRPNDFDYYYKDNYNPIDYSSDKFVDHSQRDRPFGHRDSHNDNWHYSHHSGHSYHRSWDSSDPHLSDNRRQYARKQFLSSDEPSFYGNERRRHRRDKLSHRSTSAEDGYRALPSLDDRVANNNGFYRETIFSWSYDDSKPYDIEHY